VTVQRALEEAGLPTVIVASLPTIAAQSGAPRILAVDTPMGSALGAPRDADGQRAILAAALRLLASATEPGTVVTAAGSYRTGQL
jgi:hypothetical protein